MTDDVENRCCVCESTDAMQMLTINDIRLYSCTECLRNREFYYFLEGVFLELGIIKEKQ